MRKFVELILALVVSSLVISSCGDTTRLNSTQGNWYTAEHKLNRLQGTTGVSGSFNGSFFLASGGISGNFQTVQILQFAWEVEPGEVIISSLPYSVFRFVIDNERATPTAKFIWKDIVYAREYYYDQMHPNEMVEGNDYKYLKEVIVRISSKTMSEEVYLPK